MQGRVRKPRPWLAMALVKKRGKYWKMKAWRRSCHVLGLTPFGLYK